MEYRQSENRGTACRGKFIYSKSFSSVSFDRHSISSLRTSFVVMKVLIGTLALLIGLSNAACPNQCSGHGTCGVDEVVSRD